MEKNICAIVRKNENNYISGKTTISKYVTFSMWENIEKIEAYLNSKHISGETDSQGREKPFFNIVTSAVNVWYRATDIDRKDIKIKATKITDMLLSFIANVLLQNYMRRDAFGKFLNQWGRSLARYGSSVIKFVESGGQLHASVVTWNRLIVDTISFDADCVIEKIYFTPAQLMKNKAYDQTKVTSLLEKLKTRQALDKQNKDSNQANYIEVYEVHGEFSVATLKLAKGIDEKEIKDSDKTTFVQQMHVVSYVASDKDKDTYDDFTLYAGKEAKSPYMITHLIEEDGRTQSIGAVEHLFEAQWMQNHTAKAIKDQLDMASKLIFQTADGSFVGVNAIDSMDNGDILIHADGKPLTQLQNNSHDIVALQSFQNQWKALAQEITSTPDAIQGNNMPSGTAYRQVAILNNEAHSLFEIMTENKGLAIEEMMREFILPHLKKTLNHSKEICAILDSEGIAKIDLAYINAEVARRNNKHIAEQIFNNQIATPLDTTAEANKIQGQLSQLGNQRFFKPSDLDDKTWAELFKDFVWDVEVDVTNEQGDKEVIMTTLTTVLQTIASNPDILNNPTAKVLFNKILEETGQVSSVELDQQDNKPNPQPNNQQTTNNQVVTPPSNQVTPSATS